MKIALIGYGKMGRILDQRASKMGHEIVLRIDVAGPNKIEELSKVAVDVAIEFTNPEAAPDNIQSCIEAGVPVVVGSTGWYRHYDRLSQLCRQHHSAIFTATNFSIGVNIFFAVSAYLAQRMNEFSEYDISMQETHHIHKLDAPSGTAITLAEGILEKIERKSAWTQPPETGPDRLTITSHRRDEVPGTHVVNYASSVDAIEIKHTAHSRDGFALGAIHAAQWLIGKTGVFGMNDLLSSSNLGA